MEEVTFCEAHLENSVLLGQIGVCCEMEAGEFSFPTLEHDPWVKCVSHEVIL